MKAIVINVPGSLLQVDPPVLRKDEFLKQWENSGMTRIATVEFLSNVCTPKEIVNNDLLRIIAKQHDTFVPPPLRKRLMGLELLTDAQKAQGTAMAEALIAEHWDLLIATLQTLDFKCRDVDKVAQHLMPLDNLDAQAQSWLLDAVRTKLTRTACTESHLRTYQALGSTGIGLLMEDDVVMLPELPLQIGEILEWLAANDPKWDFVQLGWSRHPERSVWPIHQSPLSRAPDGAYGNTAVLVNLENGAHDRLVQAITKHRQSGAQVVANDVILAQGNFNRYLATVRLIGPPPGDHASVLTGSTMNYGSVCWDAEQLDMLKK